jgi:hypothetical protein
MRSLYRTSILALVLLLFASGGARAGVLLTSARVNNPFSFLYAPGASSTAPVALNDSGATSLAFSTATSQTVVATFSAECSGDTAGTWVVAVVAIDGVIAAGDSSFRYTRLCAGAEPAKAISRTVFKSLAAGNHTIQVIAAIEGPPYGPNYQGTFERIVLTVTN